MEKRRVGRVGRRGDEKWADSLSFDPSLSEVPFNVSTETTWGPGREGGCVFVYQHGGGISVQ